MKCKYCENDHKEITGYWFSDGGSAEEENDFVCVECFDGKTQKISEIEHLCKKRIDRNCTTLCDPFKQGLFRAYMDVLNHIRGENGKNNQRARSKLDKDSFKPRR